MHQGPIGIFDSGLGGVSTLRQALALMPGENFVYYGDCANAPYGCRPPEEVRAFAIKAGRILVEQGIKVLMMACNTATATALLDIQAALPVPVVGIYPAVRSASKRPGSGKILMMATETCTNHPAYQSLHASLPDPERVINIPCPGLLVQLVERGDLSGSLFHGPLMQLLSPYRNEPVDAVVLGCTHYPFFQEAVQACCRELFHKECTFYEGGAETIAATKELLELHGMENTAGTGKVTFLTSGDYGLYYPRFQKLLNLKLPRF